MKFGDFLKIEKNNLIQIDSNMHYIIAGVQNYGKGVLNKRNVKGSELTMKKYQLIKENQLMWCKVDTKNGAFGVTKKEHIGSLASTNMCLANINTKKVLPDFLQLLFTLDWFYNLITEKSTGTTNRQYLTPPQILELIEIADFTIPEQREFIRKYKAFVNGGLKEELLNQQNYLQQLRQAILQDAVQGKLAKQNKDDEPAEKLLIKILKEKDQLIKDKVFQKPKESSLIEDGGYPYEIPTNWTLAKLVDLCFITKLAGFEYSKYIKLQDQGEVPVVRAQNVRKNYIDETNLQFIALKTSLLLDRCSLNSPSLLITFIGAGIGDVAVFNKKERWHLAPNVAKAVPFNHYEEKININYLCYYLLSSIGQNELFKFNKATAQPNLSMGTIRQAIVALPPLPEQRRIVGKVEQLMQMINQLDQQVQQSHAQAEQLLHAVLKEAFTHKEKAYEENEMITMAAEESHKFNHQP